MRSEALFEESTTLTRAEESSGLGFFVFPWQIGLPRTTRTMGPPENSNTCSDFCRTLCWAEAEKQKLLVRKCCLVTFQCHFHSVFLASAWFKKKTCSVNRLGVSQSNIGTRYWSNTIKKYIGLYQPATKTSDTNSPFHHHSCWCSIGPILPSTNTQGRDIGIVLEVKLLYQDTPTVD